jgi:hypothetical protein
MTFLYRSFLRHGQADELALFSICRLLNTVMAGEGRPSTTFLTVIGKVVDGGAKPRHDAKKVLHGIG